MQGLEIGGGGSTYGAMDTMDLAPEGEINFDHLVPPQDNAWYDTDL